MMAEQQQQEEESLCTDVLPTQVPQESIHYIKQTHTEAEAEAKTGVHTECFLRHSNGQMKRTGGESAERAAGRDERRGQSIRNAERHAHTFTHVQETFLCVIKQGERTVSFMI